MTGSLSLSVTGLWEIFPRYSGKDASVEAMARKRTYSPEALAKARSRRSRKGAYRRNPDLRRLANFYSDRGYEAVDAVRRAIEDLFPTSPGDRLEFPGLGVWSMGPERLSHRISDNLRCLRSQPGAWSGDAPNSPEAERP